MIGLSEVWKHEQKERSKDMRKVTRERGGSVGAKQLGGARGGEGSLKLNAQ